MTAFRHRLTSLLLLTLALPLASCTSNANSSSVVSATARTSVTPLPSHSLTLSPLRSCAASGLTARLDRRGGEAEQTFSVIVFTNVSREACTLDGYPALSFPAHAADLRVSVHDSDTYFRPDPGPSVVVLEPGGSASSALSTVLAGHAGRDIEIIDKLAITPPGTHMGLTISVALAIGPDRDTHPLFVTALAPGSTGPPQ